MKETQGKKKRRPVRKKATKAKAKKVQKKPVKKVKKQVKKPVKKQVKKPVKKIVRTIGRKAKRIKRRTKKIRQAVHETPEVIKRSRDLTYKYTGDSQWLILELHDDRSLEELSVQVENNVVSIFGEDTEFFIPVYYEQVKEKGVTICLFEGYVFVQENDRTQEILEDMKSEYIRGPLLKKGANQYVTCKDINKFKKDLQNKIHNMVPRKGQRVTARIGVFKGLEGKVLSVDKKNLTAHVVFEKSSRIVEARVSVINLELNK